MKLLKKGKTKDVYALENGNILLQFKDDATIDENGQMDPGGNKVGATIEGLGLASLRISKYYFEKIKSTGILTHYIDCDLNKGTMTVNPVTFFGNGIEIICRLKATGSFIRRYGDYCTEGQDLDFLIEVSLKDDQRGDPMITSDTLNMLGIINMSDYEDLRTLTKQIATIIRDDLIEKGLTLYDLKLEFGKINGRIALIDEVSPGCMRVYKDDKWLHTVEMNQYF